MVVAAWNYLERLAELVSNLVGAADCQVSLARPAPLKEGRKPSAAVGLVGSVN